MKRQWSKALLVATAERLRTIAPSHADVSRRRRAEDRDLPALKRKSEYPCCAATRDELGRLCIGDCGPDCLRRAARRAS